MDKIVADPWARPAAFAFSLIGVLFVSVKIFSFWRMVASLFILPGESLSKYGRRGSWAIVTGASEGIGKEYALQLAAKGFNILLVSRTQSKLDDVASQITTKYSSIQTKTFAIDFSSPLDSAYASLAAVIEPLDVAVLINNVGQSHSIPVPFALTPVPELESIIKINCLATLRVTQLVVPGMQKRKRGLILTMASFGGILPTPLLATYSGSKAFLQHWSTALAAELAGSGVKVQIVQSYLVTGAMSKIRRASLTIPNPKEFVRAVLGKIGRSGGAQGIYATSTPFWSHGVMHWFLLQVGVMRGTVASFNKGFHEAIRKRALRKAEREGKKAQ
ncbi:NAD(P)-binding protein [Myriangium duriaei CBS 260.36]|uniref:Very-long-chain 3-oxoacyl-CoA reductase n=1 Tax=Myriangium duriaei CBS 260.36 TaxID=1168546 RepID=A0A9P4IY92_9PEZI|nr:NAD(P)-binding protein [Myriangium duriaei CBS 260.36]